MAVQSGGGRGRINADNRREVAAYVASLVGDLSVMSRNNGLTTLAYLLEMARLEAEQEARADVRGARPLSSEPAVDLP